MKAYNLEQIISALLFEIDKILAVFGLLLAISIFVFIGLQGRIVGIIVSILMFFSCLLWLSIRQQVFNNEYLHELKKSTRNQGLIWATAFLIALSLSILSVYFRQDINQRPLLYFLLISLMVGIIACQIISSRKKYAPLILIQIIIIGMSLSWTQQLITPGLVGMDPWYHQLLTELIIEQNSLPEGHGYSSKPIFHLFIVITTLITSLPYKISTYFSVSLGMISVFSIFIFLIANSLLKNYRIGLLSALLVIISPMVMRWTYWPIPNGFGAIYLVVLLFLFFSIIDKKEKNRLQYLVIAALLVLVTLKTHEIVAVSMGAILFVAVVVHLLITHLYHLKRLNKKTIVSLISLIITIPALLILLFGTMSGTQNLLKTGSILGDVEGTPFSIINFSLFEVLYMNISIHLFLFGSFIGILYMVSKKGTSYTFTYVVSSILPLLFVGFSYIIGIFILQDRWIYISMILMSVPFALSIYLIGIHFFKREVSLYGFILMAFIVLSFLSISSPSGSNDFYPFMEIRKETNYFTHPELEASAFFTKAYTSKISTDKFYGMHIIYYKNGVPPSDYDYLLESQIKSGILVHDNSLKVIRENFVEQLQRRGFISPSFSPSSNFSDRGFSQIYDNRGIVGLIG